MLRESTKTGATLRAGIRGPEDDMARRRYQDPDPKLCNGKWRIRWRRDVIGSDGKPNRIAVKTILGSKAELPTLKLAKRAAVEFMGTVNARDYRPGKIADLNTFAKLWQRDALPLLEGSSQSAAKTHIKHLKPIFGEVMLENIRPQLVQSAIAHFSKTFKRKTILNILGTLQSMMREAKNWGYTVGGVTMDQLILPRQTLKLEARCFTGDEIVRIINQSEGQWKAMFCVVAMTGIRRGELIALEWSDIDLEGSVIHLRRSFWQGKVKVLKTVSSKAILPMPAPLVAMLKWYRGIWKPNPLNLVFASQRGTLLNPASLYRDVFHPLLAKLEIPRGGFHAFRHCQAALLVSTGANPKVAQKQMRHSDIKTTLETYGHLVGEDHREAVERVGKILCPVVPESKTKLLTVQ